MLLWPILHLAFRFRPSPSPSAIREIIFLRHDRIGDLALSLPTIRQLKLAFPFARLTVVASPSNQDVLRHNPDIEEVFVYRGFGTYLKFVANHRFDLAIDPFHNDHRLLPALMTLLSGADHRIGFALAGREVFFTRPAPSYDQDKSFQQLMQLLLDTIDIKDATIAEHLPAATSVTDQGVSQKTTDNLGKGGSLSAPLLSLSSEEQREALVTTAPLIDKRLIAIHPGAFYPTQKWPLEGFTEVAQELSRRGFGIIFFAPVKEFPDFGRISFADYPSIVIVREASLRQFIAILNRCELLLCNNSGPLHLAWALGIRTVSMMGPTVPAVWWPQGLGHTVLRHDLPCSPCNRAICPTHECLRNITAAEVLSAVSETVNKED